MRYYISDLHFFHEKMLNDMDRRGFSDLTEMHEYMISRWNERVGKKDEVVILGDFSVGLEWRYSSAADTSSDLFRPSTASPGVPNGLLLSGI